MDEPTEIIFQQHPDVILAGNTFRRVPVIIRFDQTPLLEVGQFVGAGYTTRFPVYHSDGTQLAVVKGSQIYPTADGLKANIKMRHEPNLTACVLEGKPIIELRRKDAAALKGWAELYAPEGVLIKVSDSQVGSAMRGDGNNLTITSGNDVLDVADSTFEGYDVGFDFTRDGGLRIGVGGNGVAEIGRLSIEPNQFPAVPSELSSNTSFRPVASQIDSQFITGIVQDLLRNRRR